MKKGGLKAQGPNATEREEERERKTRVDGQSEMMIYIASAHYQGLYLKTC